MHFLKEPCQRNAPTFLLDAEMCAFFYGITTDMFSIRTLGVLHLRAVYRREAKSCYLSIVLCRESHPLFQGAAKYEYFFHCRMFRGSRRPRPLERGKHQLDALTQRRQQTGSCHKTCSTTIHPLCHHVSQILSSRPSLPIP